MNVQYFLLISPCNADTCTHLQCSNLQYYLFGVT